ncbi:MAG: hypothetical protein IJV11_04500 [Muribaculaceae bacterium]|nr:hypothetical protein [Muribaculaceae bacterium]
MESRAKQDIPAAFLVWETTESSDFSDGIRIHSFKQPIQRGTTETTFIMGISLQLSSSAECGAQNNQS